ncbi:helix-turn-helix domain-containing protein [Muricauda sp. DJ-13]|uniref:Helix-turn-helix domain-containing protein n=2 Tax=Croceivirga thetidis TaxID=2721623 RepID=A0ABX1GSY8_9FLAO|nr:helix-turn-helix domain-containing protein [Croceivirga thetidis]
MDFDLLYERLEKSTDHNPFEAHKIVFYMILLVTEGSYTHFLDFKYYQLNAGSALFVAKNQIQFFTEDLKKAKGYCIIFDHGFLNKHYFLSHNVKFNRLFNYHIELPVIHSSEMGENHFLDVIEKLHQEYNSPQETGKSEILGSLLNVVLLKAERAKLFRSKIEVNAHWLETFERFKNLLESNYTTNRNSRLYASEMSISYKFLNDVVKKLSGKTAKKFIDDFVTIEIKRFLVTSSLSVKEICHKTGFDEPANMIKFFKRNTNTTPLKFRSL